LTLNEGRKRSWRSRRNVPRRYTIIEGKEKGESRTSETPRLTVRQERKDGPAAVERDAQEKKGKKTEVG